MPCTGSRRSSRCSPPPTPTLSGLTLEGADGGEAITLSPAFAANTYTYTAAVVNRIDTVKLTATKNDDNAMVVITNDDDTGTAGGGGTGPQRRVQHTDRDGDGAGRQRRPNLHSHRGTAYRRTLVSNTHLSASLDTNHVLAQSFETGANLDGYTVSQVDIRFGYTSGKSTTVKIRQDDGGEQAIW